MITPFMFYASFRPGISFPLPLGVGAVRLYFHGTQWDLRDENRD